MTISTSANKTIFQGNGATTVFSYSFVMGDATYAQVFYTDASGNQTTLSSNQYTLVLNAAAPGQVWGVGGTITYPKSGSPIAVGTTFTLMRTVPDTQLVDFNNQGNFDADVLEQALDLGVMGSQGLYELNTRAVVGNPADPASISMQLPTAKLRAGMALIFTATGAVGVGSLSGGAIAGAIGLSMPMQFSVTGSPTSNGTLTVNWGNEGPNVILAGPASGGVAAPAFRAMVAADLPAGAATAIGALLATNNLSDLTTASTARTNLGLGTAATKAASDNAKATLAAVSGSFTSGHVAVFADTSGTIKDGGALSTGSGTVTSIIAGTNLSGGTITTSGTINVVANPVFSGLVTTQGGRVVATRTVTAAGAISVTVTDGTVFINKTVGATSSVTLTSSFVTGARVKIKDAKGDAVTHPITIAPASGTIDGVASVTMSTAYQCLELTLNAAEWSLTGSYP